MEMNFSEMKQITNERSVALDNGEAVRVMEFQALDKKIYQLDTNTLRFRVADDGENYGPWTSADHIIL
jgi:hypothetical protein